MGEYLKIAVDPAQEAVVWKSKGDTAAGLKGADDRPAGFGKSA